MDEYYDTADVVNQQDHMRRLHARHSEISDEAIDATWMFVAFVGAIVLCAVLRWS